MKKTTIVGGGVIGLFTAYYLTKAGVQVEIIDRGSGNEGCSHGNAGMIVPSHIIPLAAPGVISKSLKWLLDETSPFYVKPQLNLELLKWGLSFQKAANAKQVEAAKPVLRDVSLLSKQLYQLLAKDFDFAFEEKGLLMLCQKEETLADEIDLAHQALQLGLDARVLDKNGIDQLEPESSPNAIGAVYFPGDAHCNPSALMDELKSYLVRHQVKFIYNSDVTGIDFENGEAKAIIIQNKSQKEKLIIDQLIICGGAWSQQIAKELESYLPLQAGKGYSFVQNQEIGKAIMIPSILVEGKVAVTPFSNGQVRFGGTMEIAGINEEINLKRVEGIVNCVNVFYPEVEIEQPEEKSIWFGLRPCSPDGLPYIGKANKFKNVYIGAGHAMMGLSMGPATGKLLADQILGEKPVISSPLLSPSRFE